MTKLLFLIFLLVSCNSENDVESYSSAQILSYIQSSLYSTVEVHFLEPDHVNSRKNIDAPKLAWISIIEFMVLNNQLNLDKFCLLYRVPGKNVDDLGIIKFVPANHDQNCDDFNFSGDIHDQEMVRDVKIYLTDEFPMNIQGGHKLPPYHLGITGEIENSSFKNDSFVWKIALYNLTSSKIFKNKKLVINATKEKNKFESSLNKKIKTGLALLPLQNKNDLSNVVSTVKPLGSFADSYPDKTAVICHQLNKDCEEVVKYNCDACAYGYYEVLGANCPNARNKYCGVDHCGEKNWPACIRGKNVGPNSDAKECEDQSLYGYCQAGLKSVCVDNVLICL